MHNTYTYKEILLGLREEFKEINHELNILKSLTYTKNPQLEDYIISLITDIYYHPELYMYLHQIEPTLIQLGKEKLGLTSSKISKFKMKNWLYYPENRNIKLIDEQEFAKIANKILNSEMVRYFNTSGRIFSETESFLNFSLYQIMLNHDKTHINYRAREDELYSQTILTKEKLEELLSLRFPVSSLPVFHQKIINHHKADYNIVLEEASNELQIREEEHTLILTRKK